jgi:CubicO group peptidase (beta-lactamase class C family)
LPGNTEHSYFTAPNFSFPTQTEFRSVFRDLKTESEVGTDVSYSNIGYALLGEIVEKVSGVSFEAYLEKEVLSPLKMSETYIGTSTIQDDKRKAIGYTALNRNRTRNRVSTFDPKAMNPAMGLWTSIYDLAKYASWQFRLIDASKTEILKPSTLKRMHTVQSRSKNGYSNWGLGFEVIKGSNGDDWVSHGGTCPGFVSLLQLNLTTKMGYAIMINANRSSTFKYLNGMKQILSKVRPIEENKNRVNLKDYTGYYNMNPWNSEVYISSWGEDLVMLQLPENSPKYGMRFFKHIKDDTFRQIIDNGELGDEYVFERDQNGKVYRYQDRGNYKNRIIR